MATPVKLPELGESVTEGTITRWLKSVGDEVEVDEPLLEVSTDKVDTEIPSPVAGTLLEIKAEEDETVEVGAELAVIGDSDEAPSGGDGGGEDEEASEDTESAAQDEGDSGSDEGSDDSSDSGDDSGDDSEAPAQETSAKSSDGGQQGSGGSGGGGDGTPVKLPELGESVTEGTITRWLKSVGDEVEVDEPLLEVSTDKVDTEIPSPVAGTLLEIKAEEDETVEVGAELAVIGSGEPAGDSGGGSEGSEDSSDAQDQDQGADDEDVDKAAESSRQESGDDSASKQDEGASKDASQQQEKKPEKQAESKGSEETSAYVTPLVRKLAAEHDVDLSSLEGTGVGGRIRKQDVLDAAKSQESAPAEEPAKEEKPAAAAASKEAPVEPSPLRGRTEPLSRLRKVIAKRMVESLQVSAQLTTVVEVDVTSIARLRQAKKEEFHRREGVKLSFMPFFAKATVDALKAHPALNAGLDTEKGEVTYYDHENIAVAVDTEKGLLSPVIKNAGDLNVAGLARKIADVAERTRTNKIKPDELSGGTFTLTNTGSRGALFDTPIINQPQVAILGTGSVVKRPVVIDDPNLGETIAVRQMVYLALTYDHRLVDGADAARFLSEVKQRLESGQFEV